MVDCKVCGAALVFAVLASGCTSYPVPRYSISAENLTVLQKASGSFAVGTFTHTPDQDVAPGKIQCLGSGRIAVEGGQTIGDYVAKALRNDLLAAGKLDVSSSIKISGRVDQLTLGRLAERLELTITYTGVGAPHTVSTSLPVMTHPLDPATTCQNAAMTFGNAVQDSIRTYFSRIASR